MKVAVFGSIISREMAPVLEKLFGHLERLKVKTYLYHPFLENLVQQTSLNPVVAGTFRSGEEMEDDIRYLFSIGGDGTFLHSFLAIRRFDIPVVGINIGRLGFLADISQEHIIDGVSDILNGNYTLAERSLLEVKMHGAPDFDFNYALNEMTVSKTDSSSMIRIDAWINGEHMNSIWADGLIIATPTGSTAYSLSVGGPILTPDAENFVITPIAPHNLTVRPVVVPDHYEILLKLDGRGSQYLTSLDSRSVNVDLSTTITVKKADFKLKTIHLPNQSFFNTIRNKLMWGADRRN